MSGFGRVYLVGAGPWDPGLLTMRAAELLPKADVILYDYLVNPDIVSHARNGALKICVGHPPHRMSQEEIHDALIDHARQGRMVIRLKGGDPFVFGRGGEEAEALANAGIEFEVVSGITAAIASAAHAGIPVTHRDFGSTLAFCTGHTQENPTDDVDWSVLARLTTLVLYMSARNLMGISTKLMAAGRDPETPVALIRWATRPDQETVITTLRALGDGEPGTQLNPPVLVIIGAVVSLRNRIDWRESLPLQGHKVFITRDRESIEAFAKPVREAGGQPIAFPVIAFEARHGADLSKSLANLSQYDWILFTSGNGVDFFFDALWSAELDARALGHARIGCIGPSTASRLTERSLRADLVPETFVAEVFLQELLEHDLTGKRVLLARAAKARDILPAGLRAAGATVDVVGVYETVVPQLDPATIAGSMGPEKPWLTFTASSTVENFCSAFDVADLKMIQGGCRVACIGPITAETATLFGFDVDVVAEEFTIQGLVDALVNWCRDQRQT